MLGILSTYYLKIAQSLFFSLNNPVIYSILLILALLSVIYIFYVHIIIPLQKKYKLEKENLELKNARLMALFTELDPDPVFRFDEEGKIILANNAGLEIFKDIYKEGININDIFSQIENIDYKEIIENAGSRNFVIKMNSSFYDINIKGIPEMECGQIYCHDITSRKNIERDLTLSRKKLRELSNHLQKVQESEKQKISRELHDNFGQLLTSIRLNLEVLKDEVNGDIKSSSRVRNISVLLDKAMVEIKDISYRLKPRVLDDFGLVPSLKSLCNEISNNSGIHGSFQSIKLNKRLGKDLETCLYRITQEALNNIVKHSDAREFYVQLVKHPNFIRLMVEDDGVGFDSKNITNNRSKIKSLGLLNMYERTLSFNGKFIIDSKIGYGTEIIVEIPIKEQK